jgi:diadenosine tetraphosphate (Ap4A) HIT family hydrolase
MNEPCDCFYCTDAHKDYMREICRLSSSVVYLNNEQEYQGRCVVALNYHRTELFQLSSAERSSYLDDVANVARAVHQAFAPAKINYAVYGDIDSHIHFHVVPKHRTSKNWGWPFELTAGAGKEKFLTEREYTETIARIRSHLESPP